MQVFIGIAIFIVIFILKLIFGAAAGALKAVETVTSTDVDRYTGRKSNRNDNLLIGRNNSSNAQILSEYYKLYEQGIISKQDFENKKRNIINNSIA